MQNSKGFGLLESILQPETKDLVTQGADIAMGIVSDAEILQGIPVISTLRSVYMASKSMEEQLFLRKLVNFLYPASALSDVEREKLAEKFSDPDNAEKAGESLIVLISRSEDTEKPKIYGRFVSACAKGHFDAVELMRLCKLTSRSISEDFPYLSNMYCKKHQPRDAEIEQRLCSDGFLVEQNFDEGFLGVPSSGGITYEFTSQGKRLVTLGLSDGPVPDPDEPPAALTFS